MYQLRLEQASVPAQTDQGLLELSVGDLLRRAATQSPQGVALKEVTLEGDLGRQWSWSELLQHAEDLARALLQQHEPGDRICVWAPNLPEWIMLEMGAALAGLVLVTANPAFQARELRYVLEQSGSKALYCVEAFRGNPMGQIARAVCAELDQPIPVLDLLGMDRLGSAEGGQPLPQVRPEDPIQIQYTSGTTGFPKGAVLRHRGLVNNSHFYASRCDFHHGDTLLAFMPLFHTGGCSLSVLGAVGRAATIILCPLFEPALMNRLVEAEKVTHFMGVPTMLVGMLESLEQEPRDMGSVRAVVAGGSMVAPELVRRARERFGVGLQIVYGQTETSPVVTMVYADDSVEDASGTVGQVLPQTEISIRDPDSGAVLAVDQVGEICARGYMVMQGYHQNPEATAKTIDAEGWLHTGDLGALDRRGYLRVTGRVKDMIIRGGENIYPVEIENVMQEHPAIAEAAVVGLPDPRWGEIVVCFLRPVGAERPSPAELTAFCRQRLSPQKTPARWEYVESWPLTGSGKIQKFKLRESLQA